MSEYAGSINPSEVATLSLLGRGGYGYSGGHGGFHNNSAFDGSVVNANVKANRDVSDTQFDALSRLNDCQSDANLRGQQNISDQIRFNGLNDRLSAIELSNQAQHNQTQQVLLKCCCDTEKAIVQSQQLVVAGQGELSKQISGDATQVLRDKITSMEIAAAGDSGHHRGK